MTDRAAFEAFYRRKQPATTPFRVVSEWLLLGDDGKYDSGIQEMWEAWQAAVESSALVVEALRDDHCAATKKSADKSDWCEHDDVACEFVVGWNDAAAAIRNRKETT